MKKIGVLLLAVAFMTMSFVNVENPKIAKYAVDIESSSIKWKGYKPTGSHHGTINFSEGNIDLKGSKIKGGNFKVDMTSLKDADGSKRLEGHLKSADFFEVEKFPVSSFEITGTNTNDGQLFVNGNITIKGVTKSISFPASLSEEGGKVVLKSDTFQINRADFNVKYKSKSFFNDLKDKFINDDFDLQVTIVANK